MKLSPDNKFFSAVSKIGDFIVLNLLFIITCIPVITIGASCCALYYTIKKRLLDKESYIIKDYFSAWKSNFRNGTCIWCLFLILFSVLYFFSGYFANHLTNIAVVVAYLIFVLCFFFTLMYVFPLQTTFVNTPLRIIKNAFLTAVLHLPHTIGLLVVTLIPVSVTWLYPQALYFTLAYWLLIGCSLTCIASVIITGYALREYLDNSAENKEA